MNNVASDACSCRLVAVVVTHNRLPDLQTTLARLLQSPAQDLAAVVVFVNASTDGTARWLDEQVQADGRVDVIRSDANIGGAGGFEQGMRHAVATYDPDWLVLMDDDGRPEADTLARFHAEDRSTAQVWGGACYLPEGGICDMNRPTLNPFWNRAALWAILRGQGRSGFHLGAPEYAGTQTHEIDSASFVGFFISRAGIARAGYPDGSLFIYGDDVLYSLKLRQLGGRILFDPALRFEHDYTTTKGSKQQFSPLWKAYYHHRNLLMVYRLCAGGWFVLVLPVVTLKWLMKARHYGTQKGRYLAVVSRALRDGLLSRTQVDHQEVRRWSGNT